MSPMETALRIESAIWELRYRMGGACVTATATETADLGYSPGVILGLLSDTHDRLAAAQLAIQMLRANGAQYLLHAGDIGRESIIDLLGGEPAAFVWGNNDFDRAGRAAYAEELGVNCCDVFGDLELDGKKIALMHGDDDKLVRRILEEQRHDYLITGHTHVRHDRRVGRVRWINPGALYRAGIKTVALLDTGTDKLRSIVIQGG
jgi:putative phosphoesterase